MVVRSIGLLAIVGLGMSAAEAAAPTPISFNCDAAPGAVSSMGEQQLPAALEISGSVRPLQIREDNNLRPVATVKLASTKDFVALQLTAAQPGKNTFDVYVRNGDAREEERTPLGEVTLNEALPFRITVAGKDVIVAAGDQTVSVRQSFRGTANIGVSCSTGRFMFDIASLQ